MKAILLATDLGKQNELNADPKAIQQIKFFGQLKNPDVANESKNKINEA